MVVGLSIYLLQIPVPTLIAQPLELLGGMNTPLSMLITGILIASGDLGSILRDKHIWKLAGVRCCSSPPSVWPPLLCWACSGSGCRPRWCSCWSAPPLHHLGICGQFGHDEHFAAGSVVLTTLLSILILPLCALVLTALM